MAVQYMMGLHRGCCAFAQADVLGREVMAQLKAAAGDEAFLQALVQAKQHATAVRRLRRKQQASEVRSARNLHESSYLARRIAYIAFAESTISETIVAVTYYVRCRATRGPKFPQIGK